MYCIIIICIVNISSSFTWQIAHAHLHLLHVSLNMPNCSVYIIFPNSGMQFSAEAVVSVFVEHNLHPGLNLMVPSLLINARRFVVALFDPETDFLLISQEVSWRTDDAIIPSAHQVWCYSGQSSTTGRNKTTRYGSLVPRPPLFIPQ